MTTGDEVTADPTTAAESDTVTLEVAPEARCALDANAFTLRGHTFTGWNTVAGGTGTAYADGATVNLAENTTLYAQWTQNPFIVADIPDQTYSGSAIRPVVVKDADGYGIYFGRCATGDYPLIASVRRSAPRSYRVTGLKKARAYRAHVKARKKVKGVKTYIGETSPPVHAITGGYDKRAASPKTVNVGASEVTLAIGRRSAIRASVKVKGIDGPANISPTFP